MNNSHEDTDKLDKKLNFQADEKNLKKDTYQGHPKIKLNKKIAIKIMVFAAILLLIVLNFHSLLSIISLFFSSMKAVILGVFLAFVLNIPTSFFDRLLFSKSNSRIVKKLKRPLAFLLALILIITVLSLIFGMVIPQIVELIKVFIESFPVFYDISIKVFDGLTSLFPDFQEEIMGLLPDSQTIIRTITYKASQLAGGTFTMIVRLFGQVVNFFFALIFAIYIIFGKERLMARFDRIFKSLLKEDTREEFYQVLKISNDTFSGFIVGQVSEAFILGGLTGLGMMALGMPYPPMIASFVGVTALIPVVGAYVGAIFGFIMVATVSLPQAFGYIIFQIILQQLEGNIIYPKVVGGKVGLPGIWVLLAVLLGGGLFGIVGTFLAVPMFAIIYKLIFRWVEKKENING